MASQGLNNIDYLKHRFMLKKIISYPAVDGLGMSVRTNLPIYIKYGQKTRAIGC